MEYSKREIIGVIIWWAEGTKSRRDKRWKNAVSYPIEVTNTNSVMISIFLDFLRKDLSIPEDKIRVQIQIHEGDDKLLLEKYWSEVTGINLERFNKTIVRPVGKKPGKSKGTCKIRFADKGTYIYLQNMLTEILTGLCVVPNDAIRVYEPGQVTDYLLK